MQTKIRIKQEKDDRGIGGHAVYVIKDRQEGTTKVAWTLEYAMAYRTAAFYASRNQDERGNPANIFTE